MIGHIRSDWLQRTIREVQVGIGELTDPQGGRGGVSKSVPTWIERLPPPETALEALILRGLLSQLAIGSGSPEWIAGVRMLAWSGAAMSRFSSSASLRMIHERQRSPVAERAKRLIDVNYLRLTTVETIAKAVRCHPVHLERVFRRSYDTTVHRYLRLVRVEASLPLLADRSLKISVIPLLVGFKGRATFYRAIRDVTGNGPRWWRENGVIRAAPRRAV